MAIEAVDEIETVVGRRMRCIEKGDVIAVAQLEEDMDKGVLAPGSRLALLFQRCGQRQAEQIFVEGACLLGIAAAIGTMVNATQKGGGHRQNSPDCAASLAGFSASESSKKRGLGGVRRPSGR